MKKTVFKKLSAVLVVAMMAMSMTACGGKDEATTTTEAVVTETEEKTTEAVTEVKTTEATTEAPKTEATTEEVKTETTTEEAKIDQDPAVTEGFVGVHQNKQDASSFEISKGENDTYNVYISIASLSSFSSTNGTFESMKMSFTSTDQDGNPISGVIYRESDGTFTIEFTNSTWEFIKNGDKYPDFE